jgi:hypothetical protein
MISISVIFIMFLPQFFGSSAGDSVTQSNAPEDSFASVIKDVIRALEDNPTQKEVHVDVSRAEERPLVVAQEDVSKQSATYIRRAKKQKQM